MRVFTAVTEKKRLRELMEKGEFDFHAARTGAGWKEGDSRPLPVLRGNWSSLAPASFCLLFRLLAEDDRALIKQTRTRTRMMLTLTAIPARIPVVRDSMMDSEGAGVGVKMKKNEIK